MLNTDCYLHFIVLKSPVCVPPSAFGDVMVQSHNLLLLPQATLSTTGGEGGCRGGVVIEEHKGGNVVLGDGKTEH